MLIDVYHRVSTTYIIREELDAIGKANGVGQQATRFHIATWIHPTVVNVDSIISDISVAFAHQCIRNLGEQFLTGKVKCR